MGVEILRDGEVRVRRHDADELRAIREGAWHYDELVEKAEQLGEAVRDAAADSPLSESPDEERLNTLCAEIVEEVRR
jgi:hypothetical protein